MKPDFICIGAQKAGTTWLYKMLSQHPECCMPPIKELHYFDCSPEYPSSDDLSVSLSDRLKQQGYFLNRLNKVFKAALSGDFKLARWFARFYFRNYSDKWYLSLFASERLITGDVTPSYSILDESDVQRMKEMLPDAKIIFFIRNPIDRSWSHARFRADRSEVVVNTYNF